MTRISFTLTVLSIVGILAYPPVGLALYALLAWIGGRPSRPGGWLRLWGIGLGSLALVSLLQGNGLGLVNWLGMLAILMIVASLRSPPLRTLAIGSALAVALVSTSAAVELRTLNRSFLPPDGEAIEPFAPSERGWVDRATGLTSSASGFRRWYVPADAGAVELSLDLRLHDGTPGWDWLSERQLENLDPGDAGATRYSASPTGAVIRRRALLDHGAGGHTFRGRIQLRAIGASPPCGHMGLVVPGTGLRERRSVCATLQEREIEISWTVPNEIDVPRIDLVLTGFGGGGLELRGGSLELFRDGSWEPLTPLVPSGVNVTLSDATTGQILSEIQVDPDTAWSTTVLQGPHIDEATELLVALRIERGLAIDISRTTLTATAGRPRAAIRTTRSQLWFDHPNLLAHPLAVAGLVALAGSPPIGLLSLPATLAGLWFTGSRTALAIYLVAALAMVLGPGRRYLRMRWRVGLLTGTIGLLILGAVSGVGRFANAAFEPGATRLEIWAAAVRQLIQHPWLGSGFSTPLSVGDTVVNHAHNLILTLGVWYGVVGLAAGVWLAVGLLVIAWRKARSQGLLIAAAALGLSLTDYTLMTAGIAPMLVITIDALGSDREKGAG